MIINMCKEFGLTLCSYETAEKCYVRLMEEIKENPEEKVTLDFKECSLVTSSFFNGSISYMLKDYDISDLMKKFEFINIDENTRGILNLSIQNAIDTYKKMK